MGAPGVVSRMVGEKVPGGKKKKKSSKGFEIYGVEDFIAELRELTVKESYGLRGSCLAVVLSLLLLVAGSVLCVFAFHARYYSTISAENAPKTIVDTNKLWWLMRLRYLGPIMIGSGTFALVVAIIVCFDQWAYIIMDRYEPVEKDETTKESICTTMIYKLAKVDDNAKADDGSGDAACGSDARNGQPANHKRVTPQHSHGSNGSRTQQGVVQPMADVKRPKGARSHSPRKKHKNKGSSPADAPYQEPLLPAPVQTIEMESCVVINESERQLLVQE